MVGERRTDLRGPTNTLEIGKYDKLTFSVMLWEYTFVFYRATMEDNVISRILYMIN